MLATFIISRICKLYVEAQAHCSLYCKIFDQGYPSNHFLVDSSRNACVFLNIYIVVVGKIHTLLYTFQIFSLSFLKSSLLSVVRACFILYLLLHSSSIKYSSRFFILSVIHILYTTAGGMPACSIFISVLHQYSIPGTGEVFVWPKFIYLVSLFIYDINFIDHNK